MPEPKLISPLLDGFAIGEPMSDHHGVRCCPALHEETGNRFIVKIISIPASQVQVDALFLTGAFSSQDEALSYFHDLSKSILDEAEVLSKLTKLEGFLPYLASQVVEMSDGTGYEVYLISPYKRSLRKQMEVAPFTHLGAVNLALDLCAALATSRRAGYLYADLKPGNIFLTQTHGWRIGDLGFIPLSSLKYASLPDKYRSEYTAPEISDAMSELNSTIDVYALGLILYQIYNNGQLPSEASAEGDPFPAPAYADYELAEIIQKACDPDPSKRWANPGEMGQAIVAYMQRNTINDTPIIPPPAEPVIEPESEESIASDSENELTEMMNDLLSEEETQEQESLLTSEEAQAFTEEPSSDETVPSDESTAELTDVALTQEVEDILAQADELISHELPEPVVAPEPIDVPFPAPIILDMNDLEPDQEESPAVLVLKVDGDEYAAVDSSPEAEQDEIPQEPTPETEISDDDIDEIIEEALEPEYTNMQEEDEPPSSGSKLRAFFAIASILVLLVVACLGVSYYYRQYYLQNIHNITLNGDVYSLSVQVHSDINDSLLSVICTDTYGNSRTSSVANGLAQFTDLTPNTQYRVQVKISGTHRLTGVTSGTFTTPTQTEIMNFTAVAGPEDGSVILSFAVNGPEPENWIVACSTQDKPAQTTTFRGHTITLTGLDLEENYLFKLIPDGQQYLTGTRELYYTPKKIVYAQDLHLTKCSDGIISIAWSSPEGTNPTKWVVRCYNDEGFDETITTSDTNAQFSVPSPSSSYTIDVTAEGMTVKSPLTVTPNPITVTEITKEVTEDGNLRLTWVYSGNTPSQGWSVDYSIDGTAAVTAECLSCEVLIPYYPGSHYDINIAPAGDVTYLGKLYTYDAPEADTFDEYKVSAEDLSFSMCLTPDKEDWDRHDLKDKDYRNEFSIGEKASFLVKYSGKRTKSKDDMVISYIVRDGSGAPISLDRESTTWNGMWDGRYCELNIPKMPTVVGSYSIEIYFNGDLASTEQFTII